MTVDFFINLDGGHISDVLFLLSDDTWPNDFNHAFYMPLYGVGSADEELVIADWRQDPYVFNEFKDDDMPLNSLVRNGANKLFLTKTGNQIKVVFNGSAADTYGPYTLTYYTVDKFYLTFGADPHFSPEGSYGAFITRVEVRY